MLFKVRNAVLVNSVHSRLADIVKKHSKPHLPLWSDVLNAQTNVTVNIKKMVGIVLPEIKAFPKFRYEHRYDLTIVKQYLPYTLSTEKLFKLRRNAFGGNAF